MAELPEYLTDQTYEAILQRMLSKIPDDIDKSEGSFIWDALAPVAAELAQAAIWAQEVLRRGFAQTTFGQYLDLRAAEHGLTRKPAVKATGQVVFTGTPGTIIPAGTQVSTVGSEAAPAIFFVTTQEVTIGSDGTATANIEAVEAGSKGNVAAGAIKLLAQPVSGVMGVNNPNPTTGGTEEESDAALLQRLLERMQRPPDTGNKNDYIRWAKEVPGVGDAICIPLWNGPGTVKVVIVDSNGAPANQELIEAVQNYIAPAPGMGEGRAPIGASVTVVAPVSVPINVSATLTYKTGYDPASVRANVEAAIDNLIKGLKIGEDVRYSAIANAIYDTPGVEDYSNLLINGGTSNVSIAEDAKAVKGVVTLT
ncbi:baseplate J/gp47 family protein [Desulfovirgula thermocuniculi]|uniref:baseplate J/gp47 family protein n=1 Tax=Desulfovirgula thermocuniculi TaxID=348842 RepID=UPI000416E8A3|nr:baseplate J/gp47 family protein [Desulfovirgula thermocuniculi]